MTLEIGYTMMCEQAPPRQLVSDVARAEAAGFDFSVISDHYSPWLESQGHSPYAWSVLGAAAQATEQIPLMTYVTCPTVRYHPVVVAQKAATVQELSEGRFTLGLGAGENLNEHVVGRGWPSVSIRHEMLEEATEIIARLLAGERVSFHGRHFTADAARLFDPPATPVPIGIAVSGPRACDLAGRRADLMIAVEPDASLGDLFDAAGGAGKPRVGQLPVCYAAIAGVLSSSLTTSSVGSPAAGRSTPTCPGRRPSRPPAASCALTTSRRPSPAVPTSSATARQ